MACIVTIDSRTEEMCRETGVPSVKAESLTGPITRARIRDEIIRWDGAAYDRLRARKCANYVSLLEQAGLRPRSCLRDIAGAERPARTTGEQAGRATEPA